MKNSFKTLMLILVLAIGVFTLTGCNKSTESKNTSKKSESIVGTYDGVYTKCVGDPETSKVTDEEFSLELNEDGTGTHNRDGYSYDVTWTIDGSDFKMSEKFVGDPIEYSGTLKDGKLDIFNGDKSNSFTVEYVYEKK